MRRISRGGHRAPQRALVLVVATILLQLAFKDLPSPNSRGALDYSPGLERPYNTKRKVDRHAGGVPVN